MKTVSVHAIWATSSKQTEELIYKVTAALWNPAHPQAARLRPRQGPRDPPRDGARGLGIPLHPGAEKFYKEKGLIK